MKKKLFAVVALGIMFVFALSPLSYAYTEYGPQPYSDNYFYFGDGTTDPTAANGISVVVDESSISYQQTKATVQVDNNLITDRNISRFVIMANNIEVDSFEPSFEGGYEHEYYPITIDISNKYIGSQVYFQVIAVTVHSDQSKWVSAWSQQTPVYFFKPLPVTDTASQTLLQEILDKLNTLEADLSGKLDAVKDAVEKIYTISPDTQAAFDQAMNNVENAMPQNQLKNDFQQMQDTMNSSVNTVNNTDQSLKFGQYTWMGVVTTPVLDFTDFPDQVAALRRILQITLWCEFFYFIILLLRPTLTA